MRAISACDKLYMRILCNIIYLIGSNEFWIQLSDQVARFVGKMERLIDKTVWLHGSHDNHALLLDFI